MVEIGDRAKARVAAKDEQASMRAADGFLDSPRG